MKIDMPVSVTMVLDALHEKGFEAYAVGGCVRDTLLGRVPDDWDITTSAKPMQVKEIFRHTVDTGLQHGTVTVLIGGNAHEVTTYRVDGEYEDGRHPKQVEFTPLLSEDLKRRDFTINAMAYNAEEGLVDLFGGMEDLDRQIIRCVGAARERFGEDALRILRALRFGAQLGFTIEEGTLQAVRELSPTLSKISAERINVELTKLLKSARPNDMRACYDSGITAIVLPELDRCMKTPAVCRAGEVDAEYLVGEHLIRSTTFVEGDPVLRWTMLLHELAAADCKAGEGILEQAELAEKSAKKAQSVLKRLKFDNDTIRQVTTLIRNHKDQRCAKEYEARKLLASLGEMLTFKLLKVQMASTLALPIQNETEKERIRALGELCRMILKRGDCYQLKMLAVSGQDLIAHGVQPGRRIGELLASMLEIVLKEPEKNQKELLLSLVELS